MNKDNLVKIRDHLKTIDPATFNMVRYSASVFRFKAKTCEEANEHNWCGTAACVIGHATAIFPFKESELTNCGIQWFTYSYRVSGVRPIGGTSMWEFLFGSHWPNSITQAIRRINYALRHDATPPYLEWANLSLPVEYDNE